MEQGEIILYQPDEAVKLEVRLEDETVWLTQAQIVDLFQSSKANISEHIKNIYDRIQIVISQIAHHLPFAFLSNCSEIPNS